MRNLLAFALLLLLEGCASLGPQSEAVLRKSPDIPRRLEIKQVQFIDQTAGHCGPAALAMAMRYAGRRVGVGEISPMLMTPGGKGSLQQDLIGACRREGMMAVPIAGMPALLKEVAAAHPVIIFENLGLSWLPRWHYALITGYDLEKEEIIMHSGHAASDHVDMTVFERSWKLGDYWGLVVLPADELPASAGEWADLRAAVGLEQAGQNAEAHLAYSRILERWPTSLGAMIGLGNVAYKSRDYRDAVKYLTRANTLYPDFPAAQHNLKTAKTAAAMPSR